jgi:hypothetical protein
MILYGFLMQWCDVCSLLSRMIARFPFRAKDDISAISGKSFDHGAGKSGGGF